MLHPDSGGSSPAGALLAPNVLLYVNELGRVDVVVGPLAEAPLGISPRGKERSQLAYEPPLRMVPLDELLRTHLAPMDALRRQLVCDTACNAVAKLSVSSQQALAPALRTLRDALRERLPAHGSAGTTPEVRVDKLLRIDAQRMYMSGRRGDSLVLSAVSPEGERVELAPAPAGAFAELLKFRIASHRLQGWVIEVRSYDGLLVAEVRVPVVVEAAEMVCDALLSDLADDGVPLDIRRCGAAIDDVRSALRRRLCLRRVEVHGAPPGEPQLTLVVPLMSGAESAELQLAQLSLDPTLRAIDLVYVLGCDADQAPARRELRELAQLYDVSFRVAEVEPAVPYALAVNVGVAQARSSAVVISPPWVLPSTSEWLDDLVSCCTSVEGLGLLASVDRRDGASCIVVNREWFLAAGGMRGVYIHPQAEVTDLHRRASSQGKSVRLPPRVTVLALVPEPLHARRVGAYDAWRLNAVDDGRN